MRFSILVPAYNVEKYVVECIQSVQKQSFNDYEIIVIDDGSTDCTPEILKQLSDDDKRIQVVHQCNKGLLLARRAAIRIAKGDFCIFLDSDDLLTDDSLNTINDLLVEYNLDVLLYNLSYFSDGETNRAVARKPVFEGFRLFEGKEKKYIYERLLYTYDLNNLVLKAIKRSLIQNDDTDYDALAENSMGEDLLQSFYPISNANRIGYTDKSLYLYRKNDTSMTRTLNIGNIEKEQKKFNINPFKMRMKYAVLWGMNDELTLEHIYAATCRSVILLFNNYFDKADKSLRHKWVRMEWGKLLPKDILDSLRKRNPYLNKVEQLEIKAIVEEDYLTSYFLHVLRRIKNR